MISSNKDEKKIYFVSEVDSLFNNSNIRIIIKDIEKAKGYTYLSKLTNKYYIVINENLSEEMQIKTLMHELKHIELGHLECFLEDRELCEKVIKELKL